MNLNEAVDFLQTALPQASGQWADIGAGTGVFTQALQVILREGEIFALDKNPHGLYRLPPGGSNIPMHIVEGDFNRKMDLPPLDGILMANTLHYATDHHQALSNVLDYLKPGGQFLLIEYETDQPLIPWIPNPLPFAEYEKLAPAAGLSSPRVVAQRSSRYGHSHMYLAIAQRLEA